MVEWYVLHVSSTDDRLDSEHMAKSHLLNHTPPSPALKSHQSTSVPLWNQLPSSHALMLISRLLRI